MRYVCTVIYYCRHSSKPLSNAWLIKSKLVLRTIIHNLGEKGYKCKYCGKAFSRNDGLQYHLRALHNTGFRLIRNFKVQCLFAVNKFCSTNLHIIKSFQKISFIVFNSHTIKSEFAAKKQRKRNLFGFIYISSKMFRMKVNFFRRRTPQMSTLSKRFCTER